MTDADKKMLVEEVLGECWHEPIAVPDGESIWCYCGEIHGSGYEGLNRTFTTPQDFHDLCMAIKEKGLWPSFRVFAFEFWMNTEGFTYSLILDAHFEDWLFLTDAPARNDLFADWWKQRKEEGCTG